MSLQLPEQESDLQRQDLRVKKGFYRVTKTINFKCNEVDPLIMYKLVSEINVFQRHMVIIKQLLT